MPQQRQAAAVAAQGEVLQRDAAAAGMMLDPTGYESNIKMIFKHSQVQKSIHPTDSDISHFAATEIGLPKKK